MPSPSLIPPIVVNVTLNDLPMIIITALYVVATIAIGFFSWRSSKAAEKQIDALEKQLTTSEKQLKAAEMQINEMTAQQKQNVGIQLYGRRINIRDLFSQEKYYEAWREAPLLFDQYISDEIFKLAQCYDYLKNTRSNLSAYESYLRFEKGEDIHTQFVSLRSNANLTNSTDAQTSALYDFADQYDMPFTDEEGNTTVTKYRELAEKEERQLTRVNCLHIETAKMIEAFIRNSISK
jgi:hypothetical protein